GRSRRAGRHPPGSVHRDGRPVRAGRAAPISLPGRGGVTLLALASPVSEIDPRLANRRVGARTKGPPAHEVLAEALGIQTVGDLLRHYPRRYIDRSATMPMGDLRIGQPATVIGTVKRVTARLTRRRQSMVTVRVYAGTGTGDLLLFNQPWAA